MKDVAKLFVAEAHEATGADAKSRIVLTAAKNAVISDLKCPDLSGARCLHNLAFCPVPHALNCK